VRTVEELGVTQQPEVEFFAGYIELAVIVRRRALCPWPEGLRKRARHDAARAAALLARTRLRATPSAPRC
jgi:hypothetical protein